MRSKLILRCIQLPIIAAIFLLVTKAANAQNRPGRLDEQANVGGVPVGTILEQLGAKMENGITAKQLADYSRHFDLVDLDGDGHHSKAEYIEKGNYMTPQARRGIFAAADSDGDDSVTAAEYILNRIVTDEAKAIMQAMDDDKDGAIQAVEFTRHARKKLKGKALAEEVYAAFDTDGDKLIRVPEYLRVWGKWARAGRQTPAQRIAARKSELGKAEINRGDVAQKIAAAERSRRPAGPPSVDRVFESFDADEDGKLSASEIPELVRQFILPADANKDGSVTKQELEKHRANAVRPPGDGSPPGR